MKDACKENRQREAASDTDRRAVEGKFVGWENRIRRYGEKRKEVESGMRKGE